MAEKHLAGQDNVRVTASDTAIERIKTENHILIGVAIKIGSKWRGRTGCFRRPASRSTAT